MPKPVRDNHHDEDVCERGKLKTSLLIIRLWKFIRRSKIYISIECWLSTWYSQRQEFCDQFCLIGMTFLVNQSHLIIFTNSHLWKPLIDLLVGFGGAVALFLGFSFLTGVELIYFVIEYLLELIINLIKPHMTRAGRISPTQTGRFWTKLTTYRTTTHITMFKASA